MNILLVHGMFLSGCEFSKLRSALEEAGHQCFMPTLKPFDANKGILDLSQKLHAYIETHLPPDEDFVIIGFSMGCLISRVYIQNIVKEKRVSAFFSISGPHYGSYLAYLYFGQGAKDMRPGSRFLNDLNAYGRRLKRIPTYTYRLKFDHVILPSSSSDWGERPSMLLNGIIHSLVPLNTSLIQDITQRLEQLDSQPIDDYVKLGDQVLPEYLVLTD